MDCEALRSSCWWLLAIAIRAVSTVLKSTLVVLGFGIAVWALCGALVGIGRQFMSMDATLVAHAIGAPVGAALISLLYFRKFALTTPLATAIAFVGVALALDALVVAPFIEKSFEMFASPLGVWIPQALIFAATYATGRLAAPQPPADDKRVRR